MPVDVDIFDGPSQAHQTMTGTLIGDGRQADRQCTFDYSPAAERFVKATTSFKSQARAFQGSMECFKRYEFAPNLSGRSQQPAIVILTVIRSDTHFDLKFSEDQSYIHVVTKP